MMKKWVTSLVDPINKKIENYNEMIHGYSRRIAKRFMCLIYPNAKLFISIFADMGEDKISRRLNEQIMTILEHYDDWQQLCP